ncbi:MAG TPA: EamA family transporter RarD [Woeseiaceae bacterium]|nr:EamA family transporter RarD [Woeseiaceae bacterium]
MTRIANDAEDRSSSRDGMLSALIAYLLWGVFPVYFKLVQAVPPTEVLTHRIIWAVPFGALILYVRRQWPEFRQAFASPSTVFWLALAALFISANWLIYIWAVQQEEVLQASLGYYINPLMYVLVGVVFLKERLRRPQVISIVLAAVGVSYLTLEGGQFPFVAVSLALLFTLYGVIRKQVAVGAMPGLFIETLLLFPFAVAWLGWLLLSQQAEFAAGGVSLSLLLVLAGPLTVVPLLMFAIAARRLTLTVIGFMQFIAPTLQFIVGIFYGEVLTPAHIVCFGCIWAAVAIFSIDAFYQQKRKPPRIPSAGA